MSEKCMIGDPITKSGDPHPGSGATPQQFVQDHLNNGHVSHLPRPEQANRLDYVAPPEFNTTSAPRVLITDKSGQHDVTDKYVGTERPVTLVINETTFVTDPETGGTKGQKLARFDMIPPDVLWELAEHYGKGEAKYPSDETGLPNWQRGYNWRLSVAALMRHFVAFLMGEDIDPETGSSHLIAVVWHAMALRWFQLHGKGKDYRSVANMAN